MDKFLKRLKFKFKWNYIVIPLITVLVAATGSVFTSIGMVWYKTELIMPNLTPPNYLFPIAWNIIFICATISALLVWNSNKFVEKYLIILRRKVKDFHFIVGLFIINAVLNTLWSLIFFTFRMLNLALAEMILLEITIILLIIFIWRYSKLASLLLLPYFLWVGFASYLTYMIVLLN